MTKTLYSIPLSRFAIVITISVFVLGFGSVFYMQDRFNYDNETILFHVGLIFVGYCLGGMPLIAMLREEKKIID